MNFDRTSRSASSQSTGTGEIKQLMNRVELVDYCEERREFEQTDSAREEQREMDRTNFIHGTTL